MHVTCADTNKLKCVCSFLGEFVLLIFCYSSLNTLPILHLPSVAPLYPHRRSQNTFSDDKFRVKTKKNNGRDAWESRKWRRWNATHAELTPQISVFTNWHILTSTSDAISPWLFNFWFNIELSWSVRLVHFWESLWQGRIWSSLSARALEALVRVRID